MATFGFGAGAVWTTPLTDANGAAIANPTPLLVGTLQDCSVDISGDVKELYGQNQFAEAVARGKAKIAIKLKFARWNGALLNSIYFGQTMTSSLIGAFYDTVGAIVPSTPFTITPIVPSAGTWTRDLGVRNSIGNPMTRVASAPATGQYSVTAGAYLFAAADAAQTVFINFAYTATSTVAKTGIVQNVAMGAAPTFRCDLTNGLNGNAVALSLYSCVATKLSMATKLDDFNIPQIDASAFADSAGRVLQWGTSE